MVTKLLQQDWLWIWNHFFRCDDYVGAWNTHHRISNFTGFKSESGRYIENGINILSFLAILLSENEGEASFGFPFQFSSSEINSTFICSPGEIDLKSDKSPRIFPQIFTALYPLGFEEVLTGVGPKNIQKALLGGQ